MHWDEREETLRAWGRGLIALALLAGLGCIALSFVLRSADPFAAYLVWLALVAAIILGHGILVWMLVGGAVFLARGFRKLWSG
jgi:hypothetical protein